MKKQRTRAAIQAEALRLFAEQGYEATTCEQIAASAEVSPATLFRYFPTKEDLVLSDDYDPLMLRLLAERPPGEPPIRALREVLRGGLGEIFARDEAAIRERARLFLSVPALRARIYEQQRATETMFAAELAPRIGAAPGDLRVRVAAAAIAGAAMVVMEIWVLEGGDLLRIYDDALAALETAFWQHGQG